jgi:hypothetical protein
VAATLSRSGANLRLPNAPGGTGQASGGSINGTVFIIWDESFPPTPWPNAYRFSAMSPPMDTFTRIDGDPLYSNFGEEMLGGLDFSGDGFAELFVGNLIASPEGRIAAGIGYVIYNVANLRGLSFRINAPPNDVFVTTIFGPRPSAIGGDTAAQGDFDGDGINDLAFGIPGDSPQQRAKAGSLHLFYGQPGGWPELVNLRPDTNGFQDVYPSPQIMRIAEIQGAHGTEESNTGDTLGYSGTAADINRDGRTDLIINEMVGDGTTVPDVGNLLLISGAGLLNNPSFNLELSEAGPIQFGSHDMDKGEGEEQTLSVTNTSSTNQVINSIIIEGPNAGDFSIISQSPGSILASGEVKSIVINFNPASAGFKGAAVVIRTKLNTIHFRIGLTGSGVQNNDDSIQLRIQKTETDIALQFDSDSELNYFLQSSDDLELWLTRSLTPDTGSEVNVYQPNAVEPANSKLFYRLLATPRD